jgi:putative transposase
MDFMVSLPPSKGFDVIMVVVDQFSKMAHFILTKESATGQEIRRLFFIHVFKHHGRNYIIMTCEYFHNLLTYHIY